MPDPAAALGIFMLVVVVLAFFFWPDRGMVARAYRLLGDTRRVRLEDALKHIYMCGRRGRSCNMESLAGYLGVSVGKAAEVLRVLVETELVDSEVAGPVLTEEGRRVAVRLVRTHRLWERYLADRTGVPAGEWHAHAERVEHALSEEEVDDLEHRLGFPRWDPHGDPIPTSGGDLPPLRGGSLWDAPEESTVEVLHVEDEPPELYEDLVARGMTPGVRLRVIERNSRGVTVGMDGDVWTLDPVGAHNLTVRELPPGTAAEERGRTLRDLVLGEAAEVVGIAPWCQGTQRRRLLDLGVVKGTVITPELVGASGDPVAYRIRGALVALRGDQA
ncbi:MAG: FeoA domain-containing protein, partial [Gemmatimonadota bacterium]|nr:FeoA domain-containing protein [Gemmatimonadota bacterium]